MIPFAAYALPFPCPAANLTAGLFFFHRRLSPRLAKTGLHC